MNGGPYSLYTFQCEHLTKDDDDNDNNNDDDKKWWVGSNSVEISYSLPHFRAYPPLSSPIRYLIQPNLFVSKSSNRSAVPTRAGLTNPSFASSVVSASKTFT